MNAPNSVGSLGRRSLQRRLADASAQQCFSISKSAGTSFRSVKRAREGRRFSAEHFMRLCSHFEIDPQTGETCTPFECGPILWWFLGIGLAVRRNLLGMTVTKAAKQIGISHATASRAENGKSVSIESFLAICQFVDVDPRECVYCYDGPENVNGDKCIGLVDRREASLAGGVS